MIKARDKLRKRIILLTGSELRHQFVRKALALCDGIELIATYCENPEKSLRARIDADPGASELMRRHIELREQSEEDFFGSFVALASDRSSPRTIRKGAINEPSVQDAIIDENADLLLCYGSSLIKGRLLEAYAGRFLNVHLGLSPYYRGSGTNAWPLVNREPEYVGATFMHIDAGIDTGEIIHQIRARIRPGDGPHQIGNRLIADMTRVYTRIVRAFDDLMPMPQPDPNIGRCYRVDDFDNKAVEQLYANFAIGMIEEYLRCAKSRQMAAVIVNNPGLGESGQ